MVCFSKLFTLAAVGTGMMASAAHVKFHRYSDDKCSDAAAVGRDHDLDDGPHHCTNFDHGFHSFKITGLGHKGGDVFRGDLDCKIVVSDAKHCKGKQETITFHDFANNLDKCGKVPFDGRSVQLLCPPKAVNNAASTLDPQPARTETVVVQEVPTVTVTHTSATETPVTTITVRPVKHVASHHCHDDEW